VAGGAQFVIHGALDSGNRIVLVLYDAWCTHEPKAISCPARYTEIANGKINVAGGAHFVTCSNACVAAIIHVGINSS
jgi:hypothetical protein